MTNLKTILMVCLTALMAAGMTACGSSGSGGSSSDSPSSTPTGSTPPDPSNPGAGDPPPTTRQGVSTNHYVPSNKDGEIIAFTVHEPDEFTEGETYPLILHSHGYSGSRVRSRTGDALIRMLLAEGYGVLSLDERGNGESGGEVRILDPEFEGHDWLQTLDWTEENLDWLAYDSAGVDTDFSAGRGNPIMGSVGGSYGGGYQNMVYAIDPHHRLDAIAPDITWNDLRYSLFSGGVFKSLWGNLLAGLGSAPPNTQSQIIQEGIARGNTTNSLTQEQIDLLYRNSLESHCRDENDFTAPGGLTPIDAFYTQSHLDTLFNFNDAYHNFDCVRELGGDVRLMVKFGGHGLDNGSPGSGNTNQQCGPILRNEATVAWYNEKLKGEVGAADYIPTVCYNLGRTGIDGIAVDDVLVGGTSTSFTHNNMAIGEAVATGPIIVEPPLFTVPVGGDILAGIPVIDVSITDAAAGAVDPIVFIGIGVRSGGINPTFTLMNQFTPFRGLDDYADVELIGVLERLQEGDEIVLMLLPNSNAAEGNDTRSVGQYPTNASTSPATINLTGTIELPLIGTNHPAAVGP